MNYSEMSDFEINKAVAIAEGHSCYYGEGSFTNGLMGRKVTVKGNGVMGCMDFCNSWADAGPIIEKENISLTCHQSRDEWAAIFNRNAMAAHSNPLRAAMECCLIKKERENAA